MNIQESNKLIAEFMELRETSDFTTSMSGLQVSAEGYLYDNEFHILDELRYHSDWNWLMSVVEKIESLPLHEKIQEVKDTVWGSCYATVDMKSDRCIIWLMANWTVVNVFCGKGRRCATYSALVEFIKWYNEQLSNS